MYHFIIILLNLTTLQKFYNIMAILKKKNWEFKNNKIQQKNTLKI